MKTSFAIPIKPRTIWIDRIPPSLFVLPLVIGAAAFYILLNAVAAVAAQNAESAIDLSDETRTILQNGGLASAQGRDRLQTLVESGDASAAEALGQYNFFIANQPEAACDYFELAAEAGRADSAQNLATCYFDGRGRTQDYERAARWYQAAIDGGYAQAKCALGNMMIAGQGMQASREKGFALCLEAAEAGVVDAQTDVGQYYLQGVGTEQDYDEAARWIGAAAEREHANAMTTYGLMYMNGHGVTRDPEQGEIWVRRGMEAGSPSAPGALAQIMFKRLITSDGEEFRLIADPESPEIDEALALFDHAQDIAPQGEARAMLAMQSMILNNARLYALKAKEESGEAQ